MILAVYRAPFSVMPPVVRHMPAGESLSVMLSRMPGLPDEFDRQGFICVNGQVVPRGMWPFVKPKVETVTEVTFHCPPMDGGDSKSVLAIVASIALTVGASAIFNGGIAALSIAGGSAAAAGAASAFLLVGNLAISALTAPPVSSLSGQQSRALGESSANGNVLEPNTAIPRVVGERKVFPPFAAEPLTYYDGDDEIVEAVYCLAGPHEIQELRIGDARITSLVGVDVETREGWDDDAILTLVTRQSRSENLGDEMRGHLTMQDDAARLDVGNYTIAETLPTAQVVTTRDAPDEHQIQIMFPSGLHRNGETGETDGVRIPFRIRIRPEGETEWRNLPELHWQGRSLRAMRATIRFQWRDDPPPPGAATGQGFVEVRRTTPDQTLTPTRDGWEAHDHFNDGSGAAWLDATNAGASSLRNVATGRYTATFYLHGADFPRARYEIDIIRGAAFRIEEYSTADYTFEGSGEVRDPFWYRDSDEPSIAQSREGMADSVSLVRSVSIWNEIPVPANSGLALLAIRARNRKLGQFSTIAGGYVKDWDGDAWDNWVVTSNPAPHLRDIYVGSLNANAIPESVIDDSMMLGFRDFCNNKGHEVNALLEGNSMTEAAQIVASCGYGRPYASEVWGVIWDRDRSEDVPVQIFTPRNSRGFGWEKSFPILPDGFLVTFADEGREFSDRQVTVLRAGAPVTARLLEQVSYQGITNLAAAQARAQFDLAQSQERAITYTFEAAVESIVCRRGSLIGVQHYSLDGASASGRVVEIDGDSLRLDEVVPGGNGRAAAIRANGVVSIVPIEDSGDSDWINPTFGVPANIESLVVVGVTSHAVKRMIVTRIDPHANMNATISCVDEAPALFA